MILRFAKCRFPLLNKHVIVVCIFDREMNLKAQVNNICKSGYYHIGNLSAIHNSLDLASAKMATHAFVTSTLDYGNSLFYGLPNTKLSKLQMFQNAAARVLLQLRNLTEGV